MMSELEKLQNETILSYLRFYPSISWRYWAKPRNSRPG